VGLVLPVAVALGVLPWSGTDLVEVEKRGTLRVLAVVVAGDLQLDRALLDDQIPPGGVPEALRTGRVACAIEELAGAVILKRAIRTSRSGCS
jgi:hypothetical protein